jgi:hypothetical protein
MVDERVLVNFRVNVVTLGNEVKLGEKASHCGQKGRALQIVQDHTSTDLFSTVGTLQATFYEAVMNSQQRPQRRSSEQDKAHFQHEGRSPTLLFSSDFCQQRRSGRNYSNKSGLEEEVHQGQSSLESRVEIHGHS